MARRPLWSVWIELRRDYRLLVGNLLTAGDAFLRLLKVNGVLLASFNSQRQLMAGLSVEFL